MRGCGFIALYYYQSQGMQGYLGEAENFPLFRQVGPSENVPEMLLPEIVPVTMTVSSMPGTG